MLHLASSTNTTEGGGKWTKKRGKEKGPAAIISVSYALCEVENGAFDNSAFNRIYQSRRRGISVFVASGEFGDEGGEGEREKKKGAWSGSG